MTRKCRGRNGPIHRSAAGLAAQGAAWSPASGFEMGWEGRSPITDGVKLPVINALERCNHKDKEIDLEEEYQVSPEEGT